MAFKPPFEIGAVVSNAVMTEVFKVGNMGGMRRSKTTGTLVLISDNTKGLYKDKWNEGILHYTGMGKIGDQAIDRTQNKTLAESKENGVEVHLFEVNEPGKYTYSGVMELAGKPYQETQPDDNGNSRKVWMFPLKKKTAVSVTSEPKKDLITDVKYAERFLSEDTVAKILRYKQTISPDWKMEDITIKNQFLVEGREGECGTAEIPDNSVSDADQKIKIIAEAIIQNRPILYDNIKDGAYEYRNESAYPVKIEYSFLNDSFRISAYHPYENRFFMMTLDTIRNVRLGDEERKDLQSEYKAFLNKNRKKVILDVEPSGHVIERCFRVFSYYERKAVYNRKDDFYRLEITYNSYDEAEIIRDILSLGSSVVVLEPLKLRKKIRDRIIDACRKYEK